MTHILDKLGAMRRPKLLIRAARFGVADYRRAFHLRRLLGCETPPRSVVALDRLIEAEAFLNMQRCTGDASYSVARHVDMMIAILGEARLLQSTEASTNAQPGPATIAEVVPFPDAVQSPAPCMMAQSARG